MNTVKTEYDRIYAYLSGINYNKSTGDTAKDKKCDENKASSPDNSAKEKTNVKMSRDEINKMLSNKASGKNDSTDKSEFYAWLKEENKRSKESFILGKYYSGKRLNRNELKYIAEKRPDMAGQIAADMYSRAALWRRMKKSKSKTEVTMCCFSAISSSYNSKSSASDGSARVNSLVNTRDQYMRTREYAKKASTDYEARKRAKAKKNKRKLNVKA